MTLRNTLLLALILFSTILVGAGLIWQGLNLDRSAKESQVLGDQSARVLSSSPIASASAVNKQMFTPDSKFLVTKVIDGDTFQTRIDGQPVSVRLIGIDTPETVDPRRPVGCFGKKASAETKRLIEGKQVTLTRDVSDTDKYNRLLRYVFLPIAQGQTLFVNDYLVRQGFAKNLTFPPDVKYNERFLAAEKEARENLRGLWSECQ